MRSNVESWLQKAGEVFLRDIGIKKGQSLLDFGCGAGHYTIPAAKVVGEAGVVYALDKDKELLDQLNKTAESEDLKNIVPIEIQSEEIIINLEDESIDAMLLYDVLHYMKSKDRRMIYENAYKIFKADAILSVYPKHRQFDEPLWNLADMTLEDIIDEIESANFCLERKIYKKLIHDTNYNMGYVLVFRKKRERK